MAVKKKSTRASKPATRTKRVTATPVEARQEKSAFRLSTLITVLVFAGIVAAAVYLNRQPDAFSTEETATPEPEPAFLITTEALVTSIEVKPLEGSTAKLERNEENLWALTQPEKGEADQGLAEAAASQIVALRVITPLENTDDPSIYGLDKPGYTIAIGFDDGSSKTIEVGDLTPSESGYYVRLDDAYYVATLSGIGALTNLADIPPYLTVEATPVP